MNNDLPPWKEDPNNPTRKPGEKRKDKYGNEIKNVARHLARKAMNSIKEASKKGRKKDWTGAKVDKDRFILPEETDLDEAAVSGNILHGYHGNVDVKDDSERAKKFSAMHTKVKKLAHAAGHLSDAKKPNVMVKHFLDSAHGRHIADNPTDKNITSRFSEFKKKYDPAMHEEVELDETMSHDADMVNMQRGDMSIEDGLKKYSKNQIRNGIKSINRFSSKLNHPAIKEEVELEEKRGLWDNIHAKRKRIKAGSGERMRKPGSEGAPTAAALKASQTEEVEISEANVTKKNYSWGKMVTVHDGAHQSFPLHPEHQEKIKSLKSGDKTSFADETRTQVTAHREGDTVHLKKQGTNRKVSVSYSHFSEEVEIDEVAPPGAKFERMVKHIKKSYAKDGKLTDKEKSIAYATAWKAKNEEVEHENCGTPECCGQCTPPIEEAYGMWKVDFPKQHAGKAVAAGSVHVKAQNTAHAHKVAAKRVGVDHKAFKSKVTKSSILPEETEGKVYSVHVKGDSEQHNSPEFKKHLAGWGGEHHYTSDKGAAYKFKKEYQATGFHHGVGSMFKKLDSEHDGQVKEELGKSNEWGTDSLRKKFAAMTPGQEGLTAKKIPTFDARYDDVPTQYCGGIQNEDTLSEVSAKGIVARDDFRKKIQRAMTDPANIARAKKVLAKKKAQQKVADANAPKNLVHQLHKSQSINAKVKFYDGKEHEIAPNHHDKFMNKYHGLKSSIEKEALINRAHKSHAEFLKAIHEELDISQEKPNIDSIAPANYPTPPMHDDMLDYNSDDRHDEYDEVAIENDVAAEIENSEWEDLVDYYDDEDLDYEDSDEDIAEGITPQGRLKKRFNMMRNKSRRNMARNLALKRVATPDRIKSRSVRAARNMVYSRVLRGRDRSSLSASEKTRLEAMVKRMAPTVGRLSIRLQQKERMIDRQRINNRNKKKKKK